MLGCLSGNGCYPSCPTGDGYLFATPLLLLLYQNQNQNRHLWHKMSILEPPEELVKVIQKYLIWYCFYPDKKEDKDWWTPKAS